MNRAKTILLLPICWIRHAFGRQFVEHYKDFNVCPTISEAVKQIIQEAHVQHLVEQGV